MAWASRFMVERMIKLCRERISGYVESYQYYMHHRRFPFGISCVNDPSRTYLYYLNTSFFSHHSHMLSFLYQSHIPSTKPDSHSTASSTSQIRILSSLLKSTNPHTCSLRVSAMASSALKTSTSLSDLISIS